MAEESKASVKSQLGVVLGLDDDFSLDEGFSPHRFSWSYLKASLNVNAKRFKVFQLLMGNPCIKKLKNIKYESLCALRRQEKTLFS
ncbi:hypothetical protein A2U01_0055596, partial [Trifolium medium]|nr:hypothetical protein [Trifolium medium]